MTPEDNSSPISKLSSNVERKSVNFSSKSKTYCKLNKAWIKILKCTSFLQEYRKDSSLVHCFICKANFSIFNSAKHLIDRHLEQANHKHLAAIETKRIRNLVYRLI